MKSQIVLLCSVFALAACSKKAETSDTTSTTTIDATAPAADAMALPNSGPTQAHNDPGDPQPMAPGSNDGGRPKK